MEPNQNPKKRSERILVLTTSYPRLEGDAAGHFVKAEVDALKREGHTVTVAAAGGPFDDASVVNLGGSELFAHPGALPRLKERPARAVKLLGPTQRARRLAKGSYDRVYCHWLLPTAYLWGTAFSSRGCSLVAVAHGSDVKVLQSLPARARNHVLTSLARAHFDIRFVALELKNALLNCRLPPELETFIKKAEVRPSPIECSEVLKRDSARQSLGLKRGAKWAVVVGRLIDGKRPAIALAALELVPDLNVAVIGGGPLAPALKVAHPDCVFLGQLPRDETLKWIAAADILISASRDEGAPTAIREARALGTPVVSVPAGDVTRWAASDAGIWIVDES